MKHPPGHPFGLKKCNKQLVLEPPQLIKHEDALSGVETKRTDKKLQIAEHLSCARLATDCSVRETVEITLSIWFTENSVSAPEILAVILNATRQIKNSVSVWVDPEIRRLKPERDRKMHTHTCWMLRKICNYAPLCWSLMLSAEQANARCEECERLHAA